MVQPVLDVRGGSKGRPPVEPPRIASEARGVEVVYRGAGLATLRCDQRWTTTREEKARRRKRGEGQQSDSEAANTHLRARETKHHHQRTNIHAGARVAPDRFLFRPTYLDRRAMSVAWLPGEE